MSKLTDFLLANEICGLTEEVIPSPRFKDKPFTIRIMTESEVNEYQKGATVRDKKGQPSLDEFKLREAILVNNIVEPNFKDAELLKQAGVKTPIEFISKYIKVGEATELAAAIQKLSGFDQSTDELVEEVEKN